MNENQRRSTRFTPNVEAPDTGRDDDEAYAAFYDPNPVVVLEHKGLYWSKIPGTEAARCIEPDREYVVPLGCSRTVVAGDAATIVTYGRGVFWAVEAAAREAAATGRQAEIIDLRSLAPLDFEAVAASVRRTHRVLVVTEEPATPSFASALAGRMVGEHLRSMGVATSGPPPFAPKDRSAFLSALDAAINRAKRKTG
jgi:2-oxoisovalerate dehydrogenase E1 component